MTKRINVVMPKTTVSAIDEMVKPGQRSEFITRAVEYYVAIQSAEAIQKRLELTCIRDRDLDQQIVLLNLAAHQQAMMRFMIYMLHAIKRQFSANLQILDANKWNPRCRVGIVLFLLFSFRRRAA